MDMDGSHRVIWNPNIYEGAFRKNNSVQSEFADDSCLDHVTYLDFLMIFSQHFFSPISSNDLCLAVK